MWERGLLAIGSSHFLRNLGVLLKILWNCWFSLEGSIGGGGGGGGVVLFGGTDGGVVVGAIVCWYGVFWTVYRRTGINSEGRTKVGLSRLCLNDMKHPRCIVCPLPGAFLCQSSSAKSTLAMGDLPLTIPANRRSHLSNQTRAWARFV